MTTLARRPIRLVTPTTDARGISGTCAGDTTGSRTARLEYGPRSARLAQSSRASPLRPLARLGSPTPMRIRWASVPGQQPGGDLADEDRGEVRVGVGDGRQDRRVRDAQALHATHPELRIEHGTGVVVWSEAARAHPVVIA